ncbi:hypothetical protein BDV36DRAFT_268008, partial [Aspergillus pseudocaelatus]
MIFDCSYLVRRESDIVQRSSWIWLSRHYAAGLCLRFVLFLYISVALILFYFYF